MTVLTFLGLSVLHFYWALGGKVGLSGSLPTQPDGKPLFKPNSFSTSTVAFGLFIFGLATEANTGIFDSWISGNLAHHVTWAIASIFFLRAIGDFKFVGFFKSVTNTKFAANDTKFYSPISLGIAGMSSFIAAFS